MNMYDFLKSLIAARNFKLSAMEQTIERHFYLGDGYITLGSTRLTEQQLIQLLALLN